MNEKEGAEGFIAKDSEKPQIIKDSPSIRDELAVERTKLAKERTQLAYIRTGISLMLGGLFFMGYFEEGNIYRTVGYATVFLSILFLIYGFSQHKKTQRFIEPIIDELLETKKIRD